MVGSIRLRSFIRAERAEKKFWQHKDSMKLFQTRDCKNIKDSEYYENRAWIYVHAND